MQTEILRGSEAYSRIEHPEFLSAWNALHRECGWGTIFQSPAFARTWYSVYKPLYEPLLVYEADGANKLFGLLLLAIHRQTGQLIPCGVPNAEYYVWLARDENDDFMVRALREIWKAFPRSSLRFIFLPPKTPLAWLSSRAPEASRTIMIPIDRPLCVLDAASRSESLRKKSNRSRLNRLERLGRLEFVELSSPAELETHIDRVADYCNLRQAVVNGAIPFQDDPFKRDFFLRLAGEPSAAHYTALTLNDEPIAIHFGFKNRHEVVLGLVAHSPFLAKQSPGKLLLLMLADKLASAGFERFDLTPGGSYKERFQNAHDEAYRLWAFARRRDYFATRALFALRRFLKRADTKSGGKLLQLQAFAQSLPAIAFRIPRSVTRFSRKLIGFTEEARYYTAPERYSSLHEEARIHFNVDHISSLLSYRPASRFDPSLPSFLESCLANFERGDHVYTVVEDNRLLHYSWLGARSGEIPSGFGNSFPCDENSFLLYGEYTAPSARGRGIGEASLLVRARDAWRQGAKHVFTGVYASEASPRRAIENAGFVYYGSMFRSFQLGRQKRTWWQPSSPSPALSRAQTVTELSRGPISGQD